MSVSDLASDLVRPAGNGDERDADLVRAEIDRLPPAELTLLRDKGVRILVCHDSVVDHRHDLADKAPRGWPPGATWAQVPGAYLPDENNVVVATVPGLAGAPRRIPPKGVMHSSWSLVLHETMHADDYLANRLRSHNRDFLAARQKDLASLDAYEQQDGVAGYEETYAESAARHFGGDPGFALDWASLSAFWTGRALPIPPGRVVRRALHAVRTIGSVELIAGGSLRLDLRAESEDGAIGHALVTLPAGDLAQAVVDRLRKGPGRRRRLPPSTPILLPPF